MNMLQRDIHTAQALRKQEIYQYYLQHTATDTAAKFGISPMRVYHIASEMKVESIPKTQDEKS